MKRKVILLTTCVMGARLLWSSTPVVGAELADLMIEFRIAADTEANADLLTSAYDANDDNVYSAGVLVAKWVPVLEKKASDLSQKDRLVTRKNSKAQTSVLVLIGIYDLTERNINELHPGRDRYGHLGLVIIPDKQGRLLLGKLTSENEGRHLAQIIDGYIYALPTIRAMFVYRAGIEGPFEMDEIAVMSDRLNTTKVSPHRSLGDKDGLKLTLWHLFGGVSIVLVAVLAFLPCPKSEFVTGRTLKVIKVIGICIGAIVVACYLGIEKYHGTAPLAGGMSAIEVGYRIHLFRMLMGILVGSALGLLGVYMFRRAVHNIRSLLLSLRE